MLWAQKLTSITMTVETMHKVCGHTVLSYPLQQHEAVKHDQDKEQSAFQSTSESHNDSSMSHEAF